MDKTNNLVWIDIEGTGLMDGSNNVGSDIKILEISLLITDANLNQLNEGIDLIVHQPDKVLQNMQEGARKLLSESDLLDLVISSTITEADAKNILLPEIQQYCDFRTGLLSGNSLWYDKTLINQYMPEIIDHLHHRIIDVSTIKELKKKWKPDLPEFEKKKVHRALDDIKESIEELRYYRQHFFQL